jgi:hypothetical protein
VVRAHIGNHPQEELAHFFPQILVILGTFFSPKKSFAWFTLDFFFLFLLPIGENPPNFFNLKKKKLKLLVHVQNNKLAIDSSREQHLIFHFSLPKIAIKSFAFQMLLSFFLTLKKKKI